MVLDPSDKPVLRWCLVRVRRQRSSGPLLLGSAHTRAPNKATSFAHKGGIKPLCAVLCCVIPSLVCVTGNCAPRGHAAPSGALRHALDVGQVVHGVVSGGT